MIIKAHGELLCWRSFKPAVPSALMSRDLELSALLKSWHSGNFSRFGKATSLDLLPPACCSFAAIYFSQIHPSPTFLPFLLAHSCPSPCSFAVFITRTSRNGMFLSPESHGELLSFQLRALPALSEKLTEGLMLTLTWD